MTYKSDIKGNELRQINGKYESRYFHDAEVVYDKINKVSPSFCLAKWFNVSIHIPTGKTHSCYHPRIHEIPLEEVKIDVSALHNTKYKKEQRKLMLEGSRPSECEFCWQIEDSGSQLSDRAYRSKDVYEEGIIDEALSVGSEGNANPRYVEVNFNQACNLKCTYCSPHLSTAWMTDIEKNGAFILADRWHNDMSWMKTKNMMPNNSPDNPYLLAFWEWLPQIYPTLHTFRMTGGEPLMDKNTFKMFDYVKAHPKEDLHLSITSNCCPPGDQWSKFMTSLKEITDADAIDHFMLYCSLDSWGAQAEYIRNGLDFDVLYKNITDYLRNSRKHSLTFIVTFNTLSYTGWLTYIKNIHKMRTEFNTDRQLIWFDIPMLSDPMWLNPKLMPNLVTELEESVNYMNAHKETMDNRFKGFKDFEISKVQRLIDWVKTPAGFDQELAMKNFYLYFTEHDQRRGTDFLSVFPELTTFWSECKAINE
jgi:sulfatase maturation enzyme AslB (radical SAM superfamily)